MLVSEVLISPQTWTQEALARMEDGAPCHADHPLAVCWCLLGAIDLCYPDPIDRDAARKKIHEAEEGCVQITEWNDDPFRTYDHIKDIVERAGI